MSAILALSDADTDTADRLLVALEAAPDGMVPSAAARKARTDTVTARRLLDALVADRMAHTAGNGAWTRYYAGRP